jgi:hypothetical protein
MRASLLRSEWSRQVYQSIKRSALDYKTRGGDDVKCKATVASPEATERSFCAVARHGAAQRDI